jgi:iron complex transport system substrate-binding protein
MKPVAANDALHKHPAYWGPTESAIAPIGGSFFEPSLEDIARARPDIVIGLAGVHDGLRAGLKNIAPLFIVNPVGVDGMLKHVAEIGRIVGKSKEAEAASQAFTKRLDDYARKVTAKQSVLVVFGSDVNIGVETLCTPIVDALSQLATYAFEFERCVHGEFPSFSLEQLLRINPDVIFVETFGFGPTPPQPVSEQLADNAIWKQLSAVKNRQVHEVDFAVWATSRGIRGATVVLDEAMPKVYPDVFPKPLP